MIICKGQSLSEANQKFPSHNFCLSAEVGRKNARKFLGLPSVFSIKIVKLEGVLVDQPVHVHLPTGIRLSKLLMGLAITTEALAGGCFGLLARQQLGVL